MTNQQNPEKQPVQAPIYQIRVEGHLGSQWEEAFDGLTVTQEDSGTTLLTGPVIDQAALHGFLRRIRDLGMTIVSVVRVESNPTDESND